MIVTFTVAVGGGYYLIEAKHSQLRQEVSAGTSSRNMVIPGGMPIGIYLEPGRHGAWHGRGDSHGRHGV